MNRLRGQKQTIDSELNELQSTIQLNEEMLNKTAGNRYNDLFTASDSTDSVTDLSTDDTNTVTRWTCGSDVQRD